MCAALLYPLGPAYLGTWGYRDGVRRLAVFIYNCAEILLLLY